MNKTKENLKKLKSFHNGSYGADIDKAIKALEQTMWISVSERLPEEHKEVLTCSFGGFFEIQSFEDSYSSYWENQQGQRSDIDEVVAWMPLPEPYEAESEVEE